jgi:hypothetical protein
VVGLKNIPHLKPRPRQARRQDAAPLQRDTVHANFHNPVFPLLPLQSGGGAGWVSVFSGSYSPANPTDAPEPDNTDISQFLPSTTADPQPPEDIEEQAMSDIGAFTGAVDSVSISNHEGPDPGQAITFKTTLETSPQAENDEPDPVGHLAQELAEQLVKFKDAATTVIEQHNVTTWKIRTNRSVSPCTWSLHPNWVLTSVAPRLSHARKMT